MKRGSLRKMYENHRKDVPRRPKNNVKRPLNLLSDIFDNANYIRKQGDFLPIYMLARYLKQNYSIIGNKHDNEDWFRIF